MSVPVPSTPTNPEVRVSPEGLVAVRRPGLLDEWAVVAGPGNSWLADVRPGADEVYGWTPLVPAPVLEGLRAERETTRRMWEASARDNDRMAEELAEVRRQVIDERVQATQTTQELFAKWRGERDQARAERDALSSLLRGMARRVVQIRRELDRAVPAAIAELIEFAHEARRIGWAEDRSEEYIRHWGAVAGWLRSHLPAGHPLAYRRAVVETDEEAEAHASRPSVSDQTPASPELREEYAVEWHHPDGGRTKSISCDRRVSADVILSGGPDWPGSRVVKRTVTTSAWEAA